MPLFFSGDELGAIKSVSFSLDDNKEWKTTTNILVEGSTDKTKAIRKLTLQADTGSSRQLVTASADGSTCVYELDNEGRALKQYQWKETRLRENQKFVGLAFAKSAVYSCTSNGALRQTILGPDGVAETHLATLPMRLAEFRLAHDSKTFAYAGEEVELSVWDAERTFSSTSEIAGTSNDSAQAKKRKRSEQLFPNELWRAKNLPNDNLNLRQPVRNTALAYIHSSTPGNQQQFLVGTQLGDVHRYDTRTARRPVANWKGIGKVGGVGIIETGFSDHEAFVSDRGSDLFALDLRNGKVSYGYKGISGAVRSIAPAASYLASGAGDGYLRLHSTFPPPEKAGQQQEHKGEVLNKIYMKVAPTVVVWDGQSDVPLDSSVREDEEAEDTIWNEMEEAESDDEADKRKKTKTK